MSAVHAIAARPLDEVLAGVPAAGPLPRLSVSGLGLDSRRVGAGEAFVALAGARGHGIAHARDALAAGAAVVLYEPPLPGGAEAPEGAVAVPGLRAALGGIADRFHGSPSAAMAVVGVTGTNGKTSTVQLLAQALSAGGERVGTLGTLGTGVYPELAAGTHTTPDVLSVHATLAALRAAGCEAVAMEVSSHALDQGRVDGLRFRVAVFTNLSRDHLDYHGTMDAYGAAKARLFAWPALAAAVINLDDGFGRTLPGKTTGGAALWTVSSRGAAGARLHAEGVRCDDRGLAFTLVEGVDELPVRSRLLGRFNVDNLLAVAATLRALGHDLAVTAARLEALSPVPGRMECFGGGDQPLVVVDYAHTPDALEQALASLRAHASGRLACLFGCGGERDAGKRLEMAAIAERLADRVIVTDDNPRGEDPGSIFDGIRAGFARPGAVHFEHDRRAAIALAIGEAAAGDVVLLAGKGHEPYQERGGRRSDFDDRAEARAALEARA